METILNEKTMEYAKPSYQSEIYRKFKKYLDELLNYKSEVNKNNYVPDPLGKHLLEIVDNGEDGICFLVGYTGIGKSTLIKHTFDVARTAVKSKGDLLIIPSFWDSKVIYTKDTIISSVGNMIHQACIEMDNTDFLFTADDEVNRSFHSYIKNSQANILEHLTTEEGRGLSKEEIIRRELYKTENNHKIEYKSSQLKYLISKQNKIKRVLIIVDDIESLSEQIQSELISLQYKIFDCLHDTLESNLNIYLIISLRPHSYRFLNSDGILERQLESYQAAKSVIRKTTPVSIRGIFDKRFRDISKRIPPGNPDTWNNSFNHMKDKISEILDMYAETIVDLCLSNVRAIMDTMRIILSNRTWCQKSYIPMRYPAVYQDDYDFNRFSVIRAIACRENTYYKSNCFFDMMADDISEADIDDRVVGIPNILMNPTTRRCDTIQLLIMFLLIKNKADAKQYGSAKVCVVKDYMIKLFGESIEPMVNDSIEYMFRNRVIRKCFDDRENAKLISILADDNLVYLTQRGLQLLTLLGDSSAIFEMFREDILRTYTDESYYTSYELMRKDNLVILYKDLMCMANEVYFTEISYLLLTKSTLGQTDEYINTFGHSFPATELILSGVEKSIIKSQDSKVRNYINEINEFKKKICS